MQQGSLSRVYKERPLVEARGRGDDLHPLIQLIRAIRAAQPKGAISSAKAGTSRPGSNPRIGLAALKGLGIGIVLGLAVLGLAVLFVHFQAGT